MPEALQEPVHSGFAVDESSNTIRFERHLDVSPEEAFRAWTEPTQVECWWDPSGAPLETCQIDLRVGGIFTFASGNHPDRPFTGVYREISRPNLLVFEALGSLGRVSLRAEGEGTRMLVEIVCTSRQHLQQFIQMGVGVGTSQTLDNLVAYKADLREKVER